MKVIQVNKKSGNLVSVNRGHIWNMDAQKSVISGANFGTGYLFHPYEDSFNFGTAAFSIEVWFKTGSDIEEEQYIVNKREASNYGWHIKIDNKKLYVSHLYASGIIDLTHDIKANTKYHIVAIYDKFYKKIKLYINNSFIGEESISAITEHVDSNSQFTAGAHSVGKTSLFTGKIYLIRVYNIEASEYIDILYNNGRPDMTILPNEILPTYSNMFINPDMEADPITGWQSINAQSSISLNTDTDYIKNGSKSIKITVSNNTAQGGIIQNVPVSINKWYTVSVWIYLVSGEVYLDVNDSDAVQGGYAKTEKYSSAGWHRLTLSYKAADDVSTIKIVTDDSDAEFYIDQTYMSEAGLYSEYIFSNFDTDQQSVMDTAGNNKHLLLFGNLSQTVSKNQYDANILSDEIGNYNFNINTIASFDYMGSLKAIRSDSSLTNTFPLLYSKQSKYVNDFSLISVFKYPYDYGYLFNINKLLTNQTEYLSSQSSSVSIYWDNNHLLRFKVPGFNTITDEQVKHNTNDKIRVVALTKKDNKYNGYVNNRPIYEKETSDSIMDNPVIQIGGQWGGSRSRVAARYISLPMYINEALDDKNIKNITNKLLFLSQHIGVWKPTANVYLSDVITNRYNPLILYPKDVGLDEFPAYGIWEFTYKHDSEYNDFMFISDKIGIWNTNSSGYSFSPTNDNKFRIQKFNSDNSDSSLFSTNANYLVPGEVYDIKIIRNGYSNQYFVGTSGSFNFYIKGGKFGNNWTLLNSAPIEDNDYWESNLIQFHFNSDNSYFKNIKLPYFQKSKNLVPDEAAYFESDGSDWWNTLNGCAIEYLPNEFAIKITSTQNLAFGINKTMFTDSTLAYVKFKAKSDNITNGFSGVIQSNFNSILQIKNPNLTTEYQEYRFLGHSSDLMRIYISPNATGASFTIKDIEVFEINDKYSKLLCDNFIGTIYQEYGDYNLLPGVVDESTNKVDNVDDFRYYVDSKRLIYAPLPTTLKNDNINTIDVYNNKVYGLADNGSFQLDINKMLVIKNRVFSKPGIAISSSGAEVVYGFSGEYLSINLKDPTENRIIGYTRKVNNDGTYTHKFYIDKNIVDTITSSNFFENSQKCPLPIDVSGSKMTISPSKYIINDLIIDDNIYVDAQFRSAYFSDIFKDDINEQIVIAPVLNFDGSVIYSVNTEDEKIPEEIKPIIEANKEIKVITKIVSE